MLQYICKKCSARIQKVTEKEYRCVSCGTTHRMIRDGEGDPRGFVIDMRQPLGIPKGSVRALLTLILGGLVVYLAAVSQIPQGLLQCFITVVFYYFGFRKKDRYITIGGTRVKADTTEPLYLPQGAIRLIILGIGVATFLLIGSDRVLGDRYLSDFFFSFGGLLIGYWTAKIFFPSDSANTYALINDIKAVTALLAAAYLSANLFLRLNWIPAGTEYAVISFYFGSRK